MTSYPSQPYLPYLMIQAQGPSFSTTLTGIKSPSVPEYHVSQLYSRTLQARRQPNGGLNGEKITDVIKPKLEKQRLYRQVPGTYPDLQQSISILEIPPRMHHFRAGGRLRVRCIASLQ
ncbi:hypothetical protein J6590_086225 [Homalodisca vitripennis]|nr:hypothetical protein J6590_086225 [Homalodisca vitripennis]